MYKQKHITVFVVLINVFGCCVYFYVFDNNFLDDFI